MDLARRGHVVERPIDALKDPVVMDLFDLPHSELLRESDLETAIISKLSRLGPPSLVGLPFEKRGLGPNRLLHDVAFHKPTLQPFV